MERPNSEANRAAYAKAAEQASEGDMVCGVMGPDGHPRYFVAPKDAEEPELRRRAFEAKHGRPMTDGEALLDAYISGELKSAAIDTLKGYVEGGRVHIERSQAQLEEAKRQKALADNREAHGTSY